MKTLDEIRFAISSSNNHFIIVLNITQGCIMYRFHFHTVLVDLEKYDDLLRKNANIRGKRWKNGEIFTVKGGGINILFWANIHPCIYIISEFIVLCAVM